MSYLVLARKWRPTTFDEVVGQEGVVRTLKNAIEMNRVAHAYLFCGARGVGKTTVARILAKALNCEHGPTPTPDSTCTNCQEIARGNSPDVLEIDGASNTGVDDVRSLRENSVYMPSRSRHKIYIIDEVHMLSTSAFNALLKTLEEPPAHVKFIFATTEPHKIPMTVLSRCQRFDFKRIPSSIIQSHLQRLINAEGASIETEGLRIIAREAAGSMRDSLSLLDQVLAFGGQQITATQVREALGLSHDTVFEEVVNAIVERQPVVLMQLCEKLFEQGQDLKRFIEGLLWHVHHLLLFATIQEPGDLLDLLPEERKRLGDQAKRADPLRWHQMFDVLSRALEELGRHPFPRLVLETSLLRLSAIEPLVSVDDLLQRIEDLKRRLGGDPGGTAGSGSQSRPPMAKNQASGAHFNPSFESQPKPSADAPLAAGDPAKALATVTQEASAEKTESLAQADQKFESIEKETGQGWQELVEFVSKRRPSLGSMLCHASPREVSAQRLCIALEKGSFFADQMKSSRNRQDLEKFCAEFFGGKTELVVEDLKADDEKSLARSEELERQRVDGELQQQALSHPMVQEAIRVFGAQVDTIHKNDRRQS